MLLTQQHFKQARSYGVYVAGHSLGGVIYPTRTGIHPTRPSPTRWSGCSRKRRLLGYRPGWASSWAGVRYRLDKDYLKPIPGGFALTGFGSAAYFYAPLYARRLLKRLTGHS